jgi:hypothetical protein
MGTFDFEEGLQEMIARRLGMRNVWCQDEPACAENAEYCPKGHAEEC